MFLNCHSWYSLRYGTMPVERLTEQASRLGIDRLALTDINNTTGMVDFVKACNNYGIHPVAGIEFRNEQHRLLYIGIARNNNGYRVLNDFLSRYNASGRPIPEKPPLLDDVYIIYPLASFCENLSENEFIGVTPAEVSRLVSLSPGKMLSHFVACIPVTLAGPEDFFLHRHLRAIDRNTLLSRLPGGQMAAAGEYLVTPDEIRRQYALFPQLVENTLRLMASCSISFDFEVVKNKQVFTTSRYDDRLLLEKLTMDGLKYRYGTENREALRRVRHELEVIDRLGFSSYFLITWDIIRYSMSRGFYHVGRGSGANSIVAYCLRITDVDPIELDLYFERFINPRRTSPPDFDIDYSWKDRDEVLEYIFKRYGKDHTALIGTISTFHGRSILRELGKVYGLPKEEIDELVDNPSSASRNEVIDQIFRAGNLIQDFPNLRSIHAGGVLISEEPLTCYTALDMPPKGFPTTQFDMYVAEDLRFEKLDILSQRGIGHIKECADIVKENRGISIDVHDVKRFKQDPQVLRQLQSGEAIGCFYIESPAMRGLLHKLRCNSYISLVAASSIIRPGVAKSGMMKEYIKRFHNPGSFTYLHPVMEQQLKETYGVMVYQEDVIKICHHFAGLDLADADVLRRAMSGKYRSRSEFQRIVDKFFSNCRAYGYPDEITREVWRQIESFAGYSFSKAHSASYAVESFQSLYLKTYFPLEFMVAVINNFGGFYRTWVYVNEARRWGAKILLPCVNTGEYKTCIRGKDIYLGFVHVMNLEGEVVFRFLEERRRNGPFASLSDFVSRVRIGLEQLVLLIRINAFRFTGKPKKELLWEAHMLLSDSPAHTSERALFLSPVRSFTLPPLEQDPLEDAYDEMELLGFPVSMSHFDLLETSFRGEVMARELMHNVGKTVRMVGNLVTIKNVKTVKGQWMHFGCFLDATGTFFDTVHFPPSLKKCPFRGEGIYLLKGKVVEEFGYPSLEVEKMARLPLKKTQGMHR